jgi:hypothetical protein
MASTLTVQELKRALVSAGFEVYRTQGAEVHLAERPRENLIMDAGVSVVVDGPLRVRMVTRAQKNDFPGEDGERLTARARRQADAALARGFAERSVRFTTRATARKCLTRGQKSSSRRTSRPCPRCSTRCASRWASRRPRPAAPEAGLGRPPKRGARGPALGSRRRPPGLGRRPSRPRGARGPGQKASARRLWPAGRRPCYPRRPRGRPASHRAPAAGPRQPCSTSSAVRVSRTPFTAC